MTAFKRSKFPPLLSPHRREAYPRPGYADPEGTTEPYVDLAGDLYHLFNNTLPNLNISDTWTQAWTDEFSNFLMWGATAQTMGMNATVKLMSISINEMVFSGSVVLAPLVPLEVLIVVEGGDGEAVSGAQASALAQAVSEANEDVYVTVTARNASASLALFTNVLENETYLASPDGLVEAQTPGFQAVVLDVSAFACTRNATTGELARAEPGVIALDWEACALSDYAAQLNETLFGQADALGAALGAANLSSARVVQLRRRPPPELPARETATASVPWHLDRIDQHELPMDGAYTANNTAAGVAVYVLTGGIDASHPEFANPDGSTRIKAGWGYNGSDPLEDCADAFAWYGFGTFGASLLGGNTMGVAKNASMTSIRFRTSCMLESAAIWSPGGLPSAIDMVLSTHASPAVMLIDTWWSPDRMSSDDDAWIESAISSRLTQAAASNITIVVPAGYGCCDVCENIFAAHPGTIAVGASDEHDVLTIFGARNSSCIDLFAPGGGLGGGVLGAMAGGGYTSVIARTHGAAYIVAGMAAQYLAANPTASPAQVRAALEDATTREQLLDIGEYAPNKLAFTNITQNMTASDMGYGDPSDTTATPPSAPSSSSSSGLSTAAIVGIVVPLGVLFIAAKTTCLYFLIKRRRDRRAAAGAVDPERDWEISEDRIEILRRPGGEPQQLGAGSFGKVVKALKDGVQVVAVKTLHCGEDDPLREHFVREIAMLRYVSRDANIVQFYGAVVSPKALMLVCEHMEGGDLRRALSGEGRARLRWAAGGKAVALDITRGLHALHTSRVSHRDIKSSNVLLTRDGRAKLGDVGLAKLLEEQYQSDGFVGTFAWAAPELLMGGRCDERVDIWSLGTVLWELATQEMPMRGMLRPPVVPDECPRELVDVIHACMQHNPEDRPSAREVYNMLLATPPLEGYEGAGVLGDVAGSGDSSAPDDSLGKVEGPDTPPELGADSAARRGWPLQAIDSAVQAASRGAGAAQRAVSPKLHAVVTQIRQRMRSQEASKNGSNSGTGSSGSPLSEASRKASGTGDSKDDLV